MFYNLGLGAEVFNPETIREGDGLNVNMLLKIRMMKNTQTKYKMSNELLDNTASYNTLTVNLLTKKEFLEVDKEMTTS